jgi:large subunit ribosomal protein L25
MEEIELKAEKRSILGKKVKRLRREGLIPAILYGPETAPIPLQVKERDIESILAKAGTKRPIALKIGEEKTRRKVLVLEVQRDVISDKLLHVDFYERRPNASPLPEGE